MEKAGTFSRISKTNIPPILYHYTTSAGMLGILNSQKIWTTKIHYLNDSSELALAFKYIRDEIRFQVEGLKQTRSNEDLEEMQSVLDSIESTNVSLTSFTENGDQLSQWRGYSKVGDGYALGFDGEALRTLAFKNFDLLLPCIYDSETQINLSKELVEYGRVTGLPNKDKSEYTILHELSFNRAVLLIAPMIKNEKFREEKEWRLVTKLQEYREAKFRTGSFSVIPYWEFDLDITNTLREIIIGPTPEKELSRNVVQAILSSFDNEIYKKVKISHSEIPYRNV